MSSSNHRTVHRISAALVLALLLTAGCGDISTAQLTKMDRQVEKVLNPTIDGGELVSGNPEFKKFGESLKKHLGTFQRTGASVKVDRESSTATRTYWGEYRLQTGNSLSEGTAVIEARFKLRNEEWVLADLEVVSPEL